MVASVRSASSALLISLRNDTGFPLFFAHPRVRRITSRRSVPRKSLTKRWSLSSFSRAIEVRAGHYAALSERLSNWVTRHTRRIT